MAILGAMQSAALRLIGRKPGVFFAAPGNFEQEIADLVNEVAIDVAKYRDWQALIRIAELDGNGVKTTFPFPDDYDRMMVVSDMQDPSNWPFGFFRYEDINTFIFDEYQGFHNYPGGWIIYNNQFQFSPAPFDGSKARFPYISNKWAKGSSGISKSAFDKDDDTFLLPERLLTLGLVWRWRENKRLDASGDQEAFVKALDEYAAKDKGARSYRRNGGGSIPGTYPAWPWPLGG